MDAFGAPDPGVLDKMKVLTRKDRNAIAKNRCFLIRNYEKVSHDSVIHPVIHIRIDVIAKMNLIFCSFRFSLDATTSWRRRGCSRRSTGEAYE